MSRHSNAAQLQVPTSKPAVQLPAGEIQWIAFSRDAAGIISTHTLATRDGVPVSAAVDRHQSVMGATVDAQVQIQKMLQRVANPLIRR